eukprot:gene10580-11517_t
MFPFHIWLPEAHVEAPTVGSVLLAGILLKLGVYGLLRFNLTVFADASFYFSPLVYLMSCIGVVYASLAALRQTDLKRIIAYSSVAHMNLVTLGIFSFNSIGVEGAIVQSISHGFVSGGLFFLIGIVYNRYHTRYLYYYGGIVHYMPIYSATFLVFTLANIALPTTSSFVGEFLILSGIYKTNVVTGIIAALGVILSGAYSLWLYNKMTFGNLKVTFLKVDTIEKPVASCATEAKGGMDVYTNNAFVKKARENVVEFLLLNHPLDCPICDQAGECDLQDQVKAYGSSQARFFGLKKTKEDRLCNPFIKTIMTRCITCTRCVRFATEIAGVEYFGTLNRGKNTEIGSYSEDLFISEISANVVDLCPVGALTSAPYAFHGRPWELRSTEAIDTVDALGSPIYVDHKENVIYRILPRSTEELKSSIIADVSRFSYENTKHNRILRSSKKENGYHLISVKDKNLQKEC